MIVIFTSNKSGGIIQLTHTFAKTLNELGENVSVFCREDATVDPTAYNVEFFKPFKTLNPQNPTVTSLAKRILDKQPKLVLFTDDAVQSALVLSALDGRARSVLSVHDVVSHSGIRTKFINKLKRFVKMIPIRKAYKRADEILLYSNTSEELFKKVYPSLASKAVVTRLGAHLVTDEANAPSEISSISDYVLFFGRIDEYKGVDYLLDVFKSTPQLNHINLVIAGKSVMNFSWLTAENTPNVKILDRFISDEEMNYLFKNCKYVILPYRDASQSGIIPIAYHFGKPVLVSNVEGLLEYVDVAKTGYVYHNKEEFTELVLSMYGEAESLTVTAQSYSKKLDWKKSISTLLVKLNERKGF